MESNNTTVDRGLERKVWLQLVTKMTTLLSASLATMENINTTVDRVP